MAMTAALTRARQGGSEASGGRPTYQSGVEAQHQAAYDSSKHPHKAAGPGGGQFAKKGTGGGSGHTTAHKSTPRKAAPKASTSSGGGVAPLPSSGSRTMRRGDAGRDVQTLNAALAALNIRGNLDGNSDQYNEDTVAAVKEVQRRLGMSMTGHATGTLIRKLQEANVLSATKPCVGRSETAAGGAVTQVIQRAELSQAEMNDLPDSAFAYIQPGGTKDSTGRTVPRSHRHFAIHDAAHVRNALARVGQGAEFGDEALPAIHKAAKKMGVDVAGHDTSMRSATGLGLEIVRHDFERTWQLEGIDIVRSEQGGDGRTVEAYAAIWDTPAEVKDHFGHYRETISRTAFDKFINERGRRDIPVYYNHGMTAAGTPSDIYSVPIGRSLEIRAESRGLWTLSRYNDGPDADRVLDAIRNGAITTQSFRGRVFKSDPPGPIRRNRTGDLPMVTRTELGLSEYGPTPTAVYDGASILALRSRARTLGVDLDELVDELARRNTNASTTPLDEEEPETDATSEQEAGTDEPPTEALRSATQEDIRRRIAAFRILGRNPKL